MKKEDRLCGEKKKGREIFRAVIGQTKRHADS